MPDQSRYSVRPGFCLDAGCKKSSAKIPDKIKDMIKMAVDDSVIRSKRTTRFPGTKEQSVAFKVWDRINEHDGKIRYQINRDTPSIVALNEALGQAERNC